MNEENINHESLAQADGSDAGAGSGSVESVAQILGEALGKQFPDDATALKAVKDTFSFVGEAGKYKKAAEAAAQVAGVDVKSFIENPMSIFEPETQVPAPAQESTPVDLSKYVDIDTYNRDMFYKDNPELKPLQKTIDSYVKANGVSHADAVSSDDLKPVLEKVKGYDEIQSSKSVVESNPRLGEVTSKLDEAAALQAEGKDGAARTKAVDAVISTLEL